MWARASALVLGRQGRFGFRQRPARSFFRRANPRTSVGARTHICIRIFHPRRYDNLLRKFLVNRSDVIAATAVVKFSHHGGVGATDQAHDAAFGAAVRTNIPDFNQHPVAVHGRAHRWRRNENISRQPRLQAFLERTGFGDDKTEAVAMHAQPADGKVLASSGLGNGIAVGIYLH